jgi:riboflavin biosynthesis pyrimidine reductase
MSMSFDRLSAGPARPPHEWLAELRPRERAPDDRPFLYLNMVASVDGRATFEGRTEELGSEADTLLLTELRALADAVLIGTGTVRAEGYGRMVRNPERIARRAAAGMAETPTAVLLSRSFDIPWGAGLFAAADQPVIVYTGAERSGGEPAGRDRSAPPDVAAPLELVRLEDPTPAAALADLRSRGVRSLLCEGGPTLNSGLLEAGVVDELFLTLSPLLSGEPHALRIVEGDGLPGPAQLTLEWVLRHDEELFLRYAVRT